MFAKKDSPLLTARRAQVKPLAGELLEGENGLYISSPHSGFAHWILAIPFV
jgi:hypothetical protein